MCWNLLLLSLPFCNKTRSLSDDSSHIISHHYFQLKIASIELIGAVFFSGWRKNEQDPKSFVKRFAHFMNFYDYLQLQNFFDRTYTMCMSRVVSARDKGNSYLQINFITMWESYCRLLHSYWVCQLLS